MNIAQIENNLQNLIKSLNRDTFIYDFLLAYGIPKASIKRLRHGGLNLSKNKGEIAWKKKLLFKEVENEDLHEMISALKEDGKLSKHDPRFIIVTDFETILAIDTKTKETLDIPILDIVRHFDFFLPWIGMEKSQRQHENPADVKAAEKMAKLYNEIKKNNTLKKPEDIHNLNVFLSRLLFCFFAEDTGIFEKGQFTIAISSHTQQDGSDLHTYLDRLFEVMNIESIKRKKLPAYLDAFPYVNGGLYRSKHQAPIFTNSSRKIILECGELNWSAINPDIFGSMIQAVVRDNVEDDNTKHYTSVPNIMKVIEPLFLNELYEEFESAKGNKKKLNALLQRIWKIKIFDPACGSGNFLIIAYKALRRLEMKIFKAMGSFVLSNINLINFYGIELDDFAHEVAILSLWLAEHQMNQEFFKEFGKVKPALPLRQSGNITRGNATRIDWEKACPKLNDSEIYILGNPPYSGARLLDEIQKEDVKFVFNGVVNGHNDLDYISCWFFKGSQFIKNSNSQCAFVSTNSISQGSQVSLLWPIILSNNIEIKFAHLPFKWGNNAKRNAGVTCVIIGLRNIQTGRKWIISDKFNHMVNNINPFLVSGRNVYVYGRSKTLSNLPEIKFGSMPNDGGNLILSEAEYNKEIVKNPSIKPYVRLMLGGQDIIDGTNRYSIWINDNQFDKAKEIKFINDRIEKVKKYRQLSKRTATRKLANIPYRFGEIRHIDSDSIIIPRHSSERRDYIPMKFLTSSIVIADSALAIYEAHPWHLGIILSKMHMIWIRAVSGRLESRIRYSAELSYNTFPFPDISKAQKQELERNVHCILEERERHSEKTLAQLYDPEEMPEDLREAHCQNDYAIERCYRSKPFTNDEERLEYLFKLYEQMITEEKERNGELNFEPIKTKKKKIKYA